MYKTILVHVDAEPGATERIRLAADLARRFEAKLIGLAAALPRPPVEAITAGVMDASILEIERDQIAADFTVAEEQFRAFAAEPGMTVEWRAANNFPTFALAEAASAADLVVIGRPTGGLIANDYRAVDPGDLVMRAGRPILIAPTGASSLDGRRVLVAWKSTREARRALADSMPFLKQAEAVTLVEIRESGEASSLADPSAFLAAHGVRCRTEALDRDKTSLEAQLTAFAERAQADLIVAGGYGHTRIRELVFGGVTRSLIASGPVPCLLSH
jgi:nucleotide-binding universal stress UspA family protein